MKGNLKSQPTEGKFTSQNTMVTTKQLKGNLKIRPKRKEDVKHVRIVHTCVGENASNNQNCPNIKNQLLDSRTKNMI